MIWKSEWTAISRRISGLLDAGRFLMESGLQVEGDVYNITDGFIIKGCLDIVATLKRFQGQAHDLPPTAADALSRFLTAFDTLVAKSPPRGMVGVQGLLATLTAFNSEFSYLLSDSMAIARRLTERAFLHLKRSLVVDQELAARWQKAFSTDEESCEKLGAVHLLSHGIWAFKASEKGERTDLLLGEPLQLTSEIQAATDALVLTEWKLVRKPSEAATQASQALAQASRYAVGLLAGFEVKSPRYLVLVSEDLIQPPADVIQGDVTYRHINIAVKPSPPSKSSIVVPPRTT